jgi:SnoaL-like domain
MPSHPFRVAVERKDLEALVDTLAPDVVFHSPLTSGTFSGREQVGELFRILTESFLFSETLRYRDELVVGDVVFLAFTLEVDGVPVEGVDRMRTGEDGKVREITVWLRPLPGTAAVAKVLSPRIAATEGRANGVMASLGVRPLFRMAQLFDRLAARMVRRGVLTSASR